MPIRQNLSQSLNAIRQARQCSISEFAEDLGLARSTVQDILSGTGNPRMDTIEMIATQLGMDPLALLSTPESEPPPFLPSLLRQLDEVSQLEPRQQEELSHLLLRMIQIMGGGHS